MSSHQPRSDAERPHLPPTHDAPASRQDEGIQRYTRYEQSLELRRLGAEQYPHNADECFYYLHERTQRAWLGRECNAANGTKRRWFLKRAFTLHDMLFELAEHYDVDITTLPESPFGIRTHLGGRQVRTRLYLMGSVRVELYDKVTTTKLNEQQASAVFYAVYDAYLCHLKASGRRGRIRAGRVFVPSTARTIPSHGVVERTLTGFRSHVPWLHDSRGTPYAGKVVTMSLVLSPITTDDSRASRTTPTSIRRVSVIISVASSLRS